MIGEALFTSVACNINIVSGNIAPFFRAQAERCPVSSRPIFPFVRISGAGALLDVFKQRGPLPGLRAGPKNVDSVCMYEEAISMTRANPRLFCVPPWLQLGLCFLLRGHPRIVLFVQAIFGRPGSAKGNNNGDGGMMGGGNNNSNNGKGSFDDEEDGASDALAMLGVLATVKDGAGGAWGAYNDALADKPILVKVRRRTFLWC